MCGIVGIIDASKGTTRRDIQRMSNALSHRGPDDEGLYVNAQRNILLAHRRLSIIDTSEAGHQPMLDGNLVVAYNGEIYNFSEIKKELSRDDISWRSNTDTEVLLRAWERWGGESLKKFRGMFAFAIWDESKKRMYVYRDRLGVKPLYYYCKDSLFICASELKAIVSHPAVAKELNYDALALFLQLGYIPAPHSIFSDIHKLEPGHYLEVDERGRFHKEQYWNISSVNHRNNELDDEESVVRKLNDLLVDSVSLRTIADVPVGVFLSGGIDSSLVAALLVKQSKKDIATFTIGFHEETYDESHYARKVASYLGTNHHEQICSIQDALEIIPNIPQIFDEPFADPSAIPTILLSQFAREHVTVGLSADGGDELFGGYDRYNKTLHLYKNIEFLRMLSPISIHLVKLLEQSQLSGFNKFHLLLRLLVARGNLPKFYATLRNYFTDTEVSFLLNERSVFRSVKTFKQHISEYDELHGIELLQHIDLHTYLPDDVMVKLDRATMAFGLEGREPLLDHKITEYINSVPSHIKHKIPGQKYLLRKLLYQYVPRQMVDRPKKGFGIPLEKWLRGELSDYIDRYLHPGRISSQGILNPDFVSREVHQFKRGKHTARRIWNLIVFQMWHEQFFN